jgi:RecQ-mediated genome instability protein 1
MTGAIVVQVLDIEDLSKSRWEQIEAIEALERGEGTKGREIIRVNAAEVEEQESARRTKSEGPHKLLLQDAAGMKVYGLEVKDVDGLGVKMPMGSKLVLKNAEVARGMILLEGETCKFLGGQIQAVDRAWKEGRKKALKGAIEREREMEER